MLNTKIIIQARNGSSRLPNKMILDFYQSKGIFEIILDNLLKIFDNKQLILATTKSDKDNVLENIAKKKNIAVFRGDENNVLKRFVDAAKQNSAKNIVRVCADNPFLMPEYIKELIKYNDYDYVSYALKDGTPVIKTHWGLFAEYTKYDTLMTILKRTQNPLFLEHVTNYIYTHSDKFKIKFLPLPKEIQNKEKIRLTLDTKEDFILLKQLYNKWVSTEKSLKSLINIIDNDEKIKSKMKEQIYKNEK